MPNIAITNYCNLKCPYCFANDMINEQKKNIELNNYIKLLHYLTEYNNIKEIGIIGGEPTLHPFFKEILIESNQCANKNNTHFTLFSNGIELERFISYIGNNISILINCNNPSSMNEKQILKFKSTIHHLYEIGWLYDSNKVTIGVNLYPNEIDYKWIWSLIDNYFIRAIRCSVVSPGGCLTSWRTNKHEYFTIMKPILLNFCKEAQKRKVRLNFDCGYIPECYFNENELMLIQEVTKNNYSHTICNPIIDITPDLNLTPCFGSYSPIPLDFEDKIPGIQKYLLYNYNIPKALKNTQGNCSNCNKLQKLQCQGGCLAFSSPE